MQSHTDQILSYLYKHSDSHVSGQAVAGELGVTRAAVWKAVESLRADGYGVESLKAKGYRLTGVPDILGAREITLGLNSKFIGREVHALNSVDSTNTYAARLAAGDAPDGTLVVAEHQTKGRGRLGRNWVSPAGMNIYASIILRPRIVPADAPMITLAASVALVKAVRGLYGINAGIKWPNDMLIGGRKAAGILTEMSADPDMVRHVVLGVGIDVNMPMREFPREIRDISTSIMFALGRKVNRAELLRGFISEFERCYLPLVSGEKAKLLDEWRSLSGMLGDRVVVTTLTGTIDGVAMDIDDGGRLLVRTDGGDTVIVTSGDVTIPQ
jgi:BirA family transcriptional regulator, biotin operon repressor / biotin---[acetyl-CoA-carboxylase] ligase